MFTYFPSTRKIKFICLSRNVTIRLNYEGKQVLNSAALLYISNSTSNQCSSVQFQHGRRASQSSSCILQPLQLREVFSLNTVKQAIAIVSSHKCHTNGLNKDQHSVEYKNLRKQLFMQIIKTPLTYIVSTYQSNMYVSHINPY